ncbi:hypothetical protein SAMN05660691_01286 [Rheinheimera pacifica]|uniref:Uncharacterized protein n=1 Tax=Rheinheimera pacifica TaxID=173990 RepID=A0A1H6KN71_9GAMM|nr:hypothetical protein [Rheinheimera pacifica]SEH77185.1 hypothetical protein SAMN05660691_01286 [Rheinheimera pacifica]
MLAGSHRNAWPDETGTGGRTNRNTQLYLNMKNYRVVDNTEIPKQNLFKGFAFRNNEVKEHITWYRWVYLCFIEVLFGEELIESLVTTSSVRNFNSNRYESDEYGVAMHLSMHVPSGMWSNLFRKSIIEVLFYKYFLQYILIEPREDYDKNDDKRVIECTRTRFSVFKPKLWQVIAFRRVYLFSWLIINLAIDVLVYLASSNLSAAILSALIVEAVRRIAKV